MDPDATLDMLIVAVLSDDWETAQERLDALKRWRYMDGFKPSDPRGR